MSKVVALECGCTVELDNLGVYDDCAHVELYVNFCEEHEDVKLTAGSDWLRIEPMVSPFEAEDCGIVTE